MFAPVQSQLFGDLLINELEEGAQLSQTNDRQIYFNSTSTYVGILAIGGVVVLLIAVALYLYDFYGADTRSDSFKPNYYSAPHSQYGGYRKR